MSRVSFKRLSEINDLIHKYGKNGIRLLFLFTLLKTKVKERIKSKYPTAIIEEGTLNRLCIQKAQNLVILGKESPTEKDIEDLLLKLKG